MKKIVLILTLILAFNTVAFGIPNTTVYAKSAPKKPAPKPKPSPKPKPAPKPKPSPSKPNPKPSPKPTPTPNKPSPSKPGPKHDKKDDKKPDTKKDDKKPPIKVSKKPSTNNTPKGDTKQKEKPSEKVEKAIKSVKGKVTESNSSTTTVNKNGKTIAITTNVYKVKKPDGTFVEVTEEVKKTVATKKAKDIKKGKASVSNGPNGKDNGKGFSNKDSHGGTVIGADGINSAEAILKQKHQYAGGKIVNTLDVLKHMVPGITNEKQALEWIKKGNVLHMELLNLNGKNGIYYHDNEKGAYSKMQVADKDTKVPVLDKNGNPKKDSSGKVIYVQSETFKQVQKKVAEKAAKKEHQASFTSGTLFKVTMPKKVTIPAKKEVETTSKITMKELPCDPKKDACKCKKPCPPPPPTDPCKLPANKNSCKCNPNQDKCKPIPKCNPKIDACKCKTPCPPKPVDPCKLPTNKNSCKCNPNQLRCQTVTPIHPVESTSIPTPPESVEPSYIPFLPPSTYIPKEEDDNGTPEINEDDLKDLDDEDDVEVECEIKKKIENVAIQNDIISGIYSYYVKLIPVKPEGFETLSQEQQEEWERTHIEQALPPQKTELADFLEENKETITKLQEENDYLKGLTIEEEEQEENIDRRNKYNADVLALKQVINDLNDESNEAMNFEFDEDNKQGLSKGGVFTVIVMQKKIAIGFNHGFKSEVEREECDDGSSEIIDSKPYTHLMSTDLDIIVQNDYIIESSYQILSARCNHDDVQELANTTGSEVISENNLITVLQSPKVTEDKAEYFNDIDISFFFNSSEKGSCSNLFSCTSKQTQDNKESDNNTYLSSVNNQLGATSNNKGASKFIFFRDNTNHIIRNNIWYLAKKDEDDNIVSSQQAESTIVNIDKNGTPNGENFKLLDKEGNTVFTGNDLQNENVKILDGEHNHFNWQGKFASDNNYPHKFRLNYMYNVISNFEGVDAFNVNGVTTSNQQSLINVVCPVKLDSKNDFIPTYFNMPKVFDKTDINDIIFDKTHIEVSFVKSSQR